MIGVDSDGGVILIESQWNLNESITSLCYSCQRYINRITVEFKEHDFQFLQGWCVLDINRITVEFKDRSKVLLG